MLKKILYPGLSIILTLIILVCFFVATSFLSTSLNKISTGPSVHDSSTDINQQKLQIIAKKLGITIAKPAVQSAKIAVNTDSSPTFAPISAVKIKIINASGIQGAARALSANLNQAGFYVSKTGDDAKQKNTEIKFKSTMLSDNLDYLAGIVNKLHPVTSVEKSLDLDNQFDVIIVIGNSSY